jgi:lactoylglutathione lyase
VDDVDKTVEQARTRWNSEIKRGPESHEDMGVRVAFITDPQGYTLEVIEQI